MSANTLKITTPSENSIMSFQVEEEQQIDISSINMDSVMATIDGVDLILNLENGSQVILENFAITEGASVKTSSGEVKASAFLNAMYNGRNIMPAAGPEQNQDSSSGFETNFQNGVNAPASQQFSNSPQLIAVVIERALQQVPAEEVALINAQLRRNNVDERNPQALRRREEETVEEVAEPVIVAPADSVVDPEPPIVDPEPPTVEPEPPVVEPDPVDAAEHDEPPLPDVISNKKVTIHGNTHDNVIDGSTKSDKLYGENGNDHIRGHAGNDVIYGGRGDDVIHGGNNNDKLYGGANNDIILGEHGNDILKGDSGNDILNGGEGNDNIRGGHHNDILVGGAGKDKLYGENGDDVLEFDAADHTIDGGKNHDTLKISDDSDLNLNNAPKIRNIEEIDMDNNHDNTIQLNLKDVLSITDKDNELFIDGDANDQVNLEGFATSGSNQVVDGVTYVHYTNHKADVYVDESILVNEII